MNQMEAPIEHKVPLDDGRFANTISSPEVVATMYPVGMSERIGVYVGEPVVDHMGATITAVNSTLRFEDLPDGRRAIFGNTVTRLCPVGDCGKCVLGTMGLPVAEMSRRNCARANIAVAFEKVGVPPEGRFMLLPSSTNAYVVSDEILTPENNGDELMHYKLPAANSVVFTESWLRERGLTKFGLGLNGADGSEGIATVVIPGEEQLFIAFVSLQQNMGDRGLDDQILRQSFNAYFDSKGYDDAKRRELLSVAQISITLAASATLRNFAHKVRIPREGADAPQKDLDQAAEIRRLYPDLIELAGGKITSAIVINYRYPGALDRGSIFPQLEAEMGIRTTPITPGNCPGDGQTCHVDYRAETKYALLKQLHDMGIPDENVAYDESHALDPADPNNNMASNRNEQIGAVRDPDITRTSFVMTPNTNRTLNASVVELRPVEDYLADMDMRIATLQGRQRGRDWMLDSRNMYRTPEARATESYQSLVQDYLASHEELRRLWQLRDRVSSLEQA